MAMAMQLMGLQEKSQQASEARAQEERQQQALERYQQGQLGIEREKLGVTSKEAEAAEKARQEERAFREGATTRDIQYKMDQAGREQEKAKGEQENKLREIKAGVLKQTIAAGRPLTPMEEAMLGNIDPEYKDVAAGMREQALGEAVAQNLERFRGMKPEQRKAMLQNPVEMGKIGGIEGYNRIMAQLGPEANQPAAPERGFWSKMFSGTGKPTAIGAIPELADTERVIPEWQQPIGPQNVVSAPAPVVQRPPTAIGALPELTEPERVIPEWQQPVQPGLSINDILAKALQTNQAQAQEMPWLYGGQGWPTSRPIPGPTPLPRELLQ
jgi:hypothetical protein